MLARDWIKNCYDNAAKERRNVFSKSNLVYMTTLFYLHRKINRTPATPVTMNNGKNQKAIVLFRYGTHLNFRPYTFLLL